MKVAIVLSTVNGSILGVFTGDYDRTPKSMAMASINLSCHKLEGKELEKELSSMTIEEHFVYSTVEHL